MLDGYVDTGLTWDVHPDLVLLENAQRREIVCLALPKASAAQLQALSKLGAFCGYRYGQAAALLYSQDSGFAGFDALRDRLEAFKLQAGLSGPFALPASARGCLLKAQLALETGRQYEPGNALYSMNEWGEVALVRAAELALAGQGFDAADFCDASLWQMARTDEEKDTQYVRSLETYLRCGMDMKRAAAELGVHRNTLAYRMERVQALFDLDFRDMNRCFELLFSSWLVSCMVERVPALTDMPFDAAQAQVALWQHMDRAKGGENAGGFACMLLGASIGGLADSGRTALISRMRQCAPEGTAFAFDEDVLFAAAAPEQMEAFSHQAQQLCKGLGCPVVFTQVFPASRMIQQARLCRMALRAGSGACMHTRDLYSALFFMAVERGASLAPYLCEDVIRVMDDDAQKGTALSRSLYAYLLNFQDMKRAAQQLGMHRNTMEYHMRKIDALIGKVEDEAHRFMMMCTYKMLALPESGGTIW